MWAGVDTLLMPSVDKAIISVGQYLDAINGKMIFSQKYVYLILRNSKKRIRIGVRGDDGLYHTCVSDDALGRHAVAKINLSTHAQVLRERVNYLHRCLGHISKRRMAQVIRDNHFTNLTVKDLELLSCCDSCHTGNSRHANRPKPEPRTVRKRNRKQRKSKRDVPKAPHFGHTVVSDSTSRQPIQTPSGKRYANITVDVHSRWTWTTLLRSLKETLAKCTSHTLKQLAPFTKIFRSDLGTEFDNSKTRQLLEQMGIKLQFSCADEHYQNGLAECSIRILQNMSRTLLADSKLPMTFWGEAMICSTFLKNRLPTKGLNGKSPYEVRHKRKFDMSRLRPFGSHCTVHKHTREITGQKCAPRSYKGIMCGYGDPFGIKSYRVYVPKLKRVVMSQNVRFIHDMDQSLQLRDKRFISNTLPYIDMLNDNSNSPPADSASTPTTHVNTPHDEFHAHRTPPTASQQISTPTLRDDPLGWLPPAPTDTDTTFVTPPAPPAPTDDHQMPAQQAPEPTPPEHTYVPSPPPPRRSSRLRNKRGTTYVTPSARDVTTGPQLLRKQLRDINKLVRLLLGQPVHKPVYKSVTENAYFDTMERVSLRDAYVTVAQNPFAGDISLPQNYEDALKGPYARQWKAAIKSEIDSLKERGVFKLVDKSSLPANANIISAKWVFKVKPKPDGTVERFKCRLCARGFLQKFGVDYSATFSPVAHAATIKLILAIAAEKQMHLRQADVSTAFLYGKLPKSERVYMHCPPGIKHKEGQVIELHRCIYGLKQASRRWFDTLRKILTSAGYTATRSDPCLYRRVTKHEETLIAVVVDDLLIASDTKRGTKRVIKSLIKAGLATKDLGFPEYIIGMHLKRKQNGDLTLNQELYIDTLLRRFEMQNAKGVSTPADPNVKLSKTLEANSEEDKRKMKTRPYRSLVGGLLYTLLTRPDCAVAVNELARYLENPGPSMWTAAKRVLRYLKATKSFCIRFKCKRRRPGKARTSVFVDSSHADDRDSRRSRCGHLIYYNRSPIHWRTTLQKRKALSTAEAEYRAATCAAKDILWLRNLLKEIGRKETRPTKMFEDNAACIKMVENPVVSGRNKYIELDCHFVRDHCDMRNIEMRKISSEDQRADLLTKNLARPAFEKHVTAIMSTATRRRHRN